MTDQPWRNALMGFARDAAPYEACGVITDTGNVWQLRNVYARSREVEFAIHPNDLLMAWAITVAVWHTHPNGLLAPSTRDTHGHPKANAVGGPLGMVIATADDVTVVVPW